MRITHTMISVTLIGAAAFLAGRMTSVVPLTSTALAQDKQEMQMTAEMEAMMKASTPSKHHKHLDLFVGEWSGKYRFRMGPDEEWMEMDGDISREWVLDGHYVREEITTESEWGLFRGLGYMGFNNLEGRYEFIWMDNMSTSIMLQHGSYDPDTKILSSYGSHRDPATGKYYSMRGTHDMSDPDYHTFEGFATGPDGKEYKSFEGSSKRIKE